MPMFYKTKPGSNARHPVPPKTMEKAVKEVVNHVSGLGRTADKYATKRIFNKDEQDISASYLKKASQIHYGLGTI
ncbi:hypothetical protein HHI36_000540 [Cryptolaemus montrouzieri]|uniref:Uncharacterized protein n=1 Tax=Cryptolaemus montrouzieri TaxID=559131 RepID=A0ABD2P4Y6_9CUCU